MLTDYIINKNTEKALTRLRQFNLAVKQLKENKLITMKWHQETTNAEESHNHLQ